MVVHRDAQKWLMQVLKVNPLGS